MIRAFKADSGAYFLNGTMSAEVKEQSTNDLPDDCLKCVFQFMSVREFLAMEQVSQRYVNSEPIKHSWEQLCKEKKIKVNWSNLFEKRNDPCPEKFTYRTEMALQYFLHDRRKLINHIWNRHDRASSRKCSVNKCLEEKAKAILRCFQSVFTWNADLVKYIFEDLPKIVSWDFFSKVADQIGHQDLFNHEFHPDLLPEELQKPFFPCLLNYQSNYLSDCGHLIKPGLLLLKGLSYLTDYESQNYKDSYREMCFFSRDQLLSAYAFLSLAMKRGVMHTSLLIRKNMSQEQNNDMEEFILAFALLSADQKDYQALEKIFFKQRRVAADQDSILYLINKITEHYQKNFPPMKILRADSITYNPNDKVEMQKKLEEAEQVFKQGIESYKEDQSPISDEVWLIGAEIKQELGKWAEADACMNKAMLVSDKSISYKTWRLRADIKEKLGDVEEAILSLNKIIQACKDIDEIRHYHNSFWPLSLQESSAKEFYKEYYNGKGWELIQKETLEEIEAKLTELQARQ